MALMPARLIIHIENFTSLPVNQRLISLQKLNFVEYYYERADNGKPITTTTDTIIIRKEELRSAMLRGLVTWNINRHSRKESMQHLCDMWREFCKELRRAMYEYLPMSTESESYWRYKGPGDLRSLLATLPPPTIPIIMPRPIAIPYSVPTTTVPYGNAAGWPSPLPPPYPSSTSSMVPPLPPPANRLGSSFAPQMAPGQSPATWSSTPPLPPPANWASQSPPPPFPEDEGADDAPLREPKTNFCFPAYGGLQGATIMIFGTDFDDETKFLFDWPYAEPSGWSKVVSPDFITTTGAIVRAPPLHCSVGHRKDVQVYILAEDAEGHTKGDAQYTYLRGRAESGHMWENLQQCLSEVDDGLGIEDFGPDSTSGKSWKDVDGDVKAADSEQALLQRHFEMRHEKGKLLHGLQHCDVHGRCALHYMAALAYKAVLRYCFEKLGKDGDRLLSTQDVWHLTPLHYAVAFERPATVELLMKHSTPQSRDLFRTPTPETLQTVWTLANGNDDVLYEIDKGMEEATEREYKAIQPPSKKRKKGYQGPDINIDVIDDDGAICLSD